MPVLSQCVVAFDERRASPASNVGTLGATGDVTWTGTKRLVADATAFVYLPGVSGNGLTVPDAAALDITGDLEIMARVSADDWTPAARSTLVAKYNASTANRSYAFTVNTTGVLLFQWSTTGAAGGANEQASSAPSLTDGVAYWLKVTLDADDGAGNRVITFYKAADQASEPSSWTTISTHTTAGTVAIFSGSAVGSVGTWSDGTQPFGGNVHRAIVRDGIGGTTALDVDTSVLTDDGATSFTATTGQTVTINRSTGATYKTEVVVPGRPSRILNGTSDYGEVADNASLDFGASDSFTVWALVRQWATPVDFGIIVDKSTIINDGWTLQARSTYRLWATIDEGANRVTLSSADPGTSSGTLAMRSMVIDRSGQMMYSGVDGTLSTGTSISAVGTLANAVPVRVGRYATSGNYSHMRLYAWGIYPGVMTATQLATLKTQLTGADTSVGPRVATLSVPAREVALSVDSREVALSVPTRTLELTA